MSLRAWASGHCILEPLRYFPSAKRIPVTLALNNTLFLIRETEYMPWEAALSSLNYFRLMFDRSEVYGPMKVWSSVARLMGPSALVPVFAQDQDGCPALGLAEGWGNQRLQR